MREGPAYRRTTAALWRRVGGEVILTSPDGPEVDRLSLPASATWLLLDRSRTLGELTAGLADEFGEGRDEIAPRVEELVGELVDRGWLVPAEAP